MQRSHLIIPIYVVWLIGLMALFWQCKSEQKAPPSGQSSEPPPSAEEYQSAFSRDYYRSTYGWGWVNERGEVVIPPRYDEAGDFHEGLAAVNRKGLWGYIDRSGREVIPMAYLAASPFAGGFAAVRTFDNRAGVIDRSGQVVIPFQYDEVSISPHPIALVKSDSGYYYFIHLKQLHKSRPWPQAWSFGNAPTARVKESGQYFLIDTAFEIVAGPFDGLSSCVGGVYRFRQEGSYGLIDSSGRTLVPATYNAIALSPMGKHVGSKDGKYYLLPEELLLKDMDTLIDLAYIGQGWLRYRAGDMWYIVDTAGRKSPHRYEFVGNFSEGMAPVSVYGRGWNWIDASGQLWRAGQFYLMTWPFYRGKARALKSSGLGIIDKSGHWVLPAVYTELRDFNEGLARFQARRVAD